MAAAELSAANATGRPIGAGAAWLYCYGAVWSATLAATALVMVLGEPLTSLTRRLLALSLDPGSTPTPTLWHVCALCAHNIPITAWPLLLSYTGAARSRRSRAAADTMLGACVIANTLPVGAALAAYGRPLVPYVPQLPLEWAALALGAAAWLVERRQPLTMRQRLTWLAVTAVVLTSAAALETFSVPHR